MLSQAQIDQYNEDGYVIPAFQLGEDVLEEIRARHTAFVARHPEFRDYCSAILHYDDGFLKYCLNDDIIDMVEQLIGPDIALWNSSFFAKPAGNGRATPWHQDGEYWPICPLATCTVWLAVDDSTRENGCLQVIKGSHKPQELLEHETNPNPNYTLNQELPTSAFDESKAADLVLKAGQISLHDVYLAHGSEANTSAKPRRGLTMRFMPTTSVFDHELAREKFNNMRLPIGDTRKVYHIRGVDRSGRNILTPAA